MAEDNIFQGHEKVNIKRLVLTSMSSRKGIDILPLAGNIEIFCSIFSPITTGTVKVSDATGTVYTLPIIGEEILELVFQSHERPEFSRIFHVYGTEDQEYNDNGAVVSFTLKIASIDNFKATATSLNKGARKNISEFITDILTNDLGTKNTLNVEETNGVERIVIPNWSIWEAIEYLRGRAVSKEYSSPYLFFEDQAGYHFLTYEKLIEQRDAEAEELTFVNESFKPGAGEGQGRETVLARQYRTVSQFAVISRSNPIIKLNEGGISSEVLMYDPFTKTLKTNQYNYNDLKSLVKKPLGAKFNAEHTPEFANTMPSASLRTVVTVDMNDQNYLSQEALGAKKLFASALKGTCIGFNTPGDSGLQPGAVITFLGPKRSDSPENDKQLNGKYIIGDLRHGILDGVMYTTVEAYKFGYDEEIVAPLTPTETTETETLTPIPNIELQPLARLDAIITPISTSTDTLGTEIGGLGDTLGSIRGNINDISSNINRSTASIRDRIGSVISNVSNIRNNLTTQFADIQSRVQLIQSTVDSIRNGANPLQSLQSISSIIPFNTDLLTRTNNIQLVLSSIQSINTADINDIQSIFSVIENNLNTISATSGDYTLEISNINSQITNLHGRAEQYMGYYRNLQQEQGSIRNLLDRF